MAGGGSSWPPEINQLRYRNFKIQLELKDALRKTKVHLRILQQVPQDPVVPVPPGRIGRGPTERYRLLVPGCRDCNGRAIDMVPGDKAKVTGGHGYFYCTHRAVIEHWEADPAAEMIPMGGTSPGRPFGVPGLTYISQLTGVCGECPDCTKGDCGICRHCTRPGR